MNSEASVKMAQIRRKCKHKKRSISARIVVATVFVHANDRSIIARIAGIGSM